MRNSKTTHNYDWITEESIREFVEYLQKLNINTEIVDPLNKFYNYRKYFEGKSLAYLIYREMQSWTNR